MKAANLYSEKERRDMFIAGNSFLSSDINKSCMAYCIESLTGENKFKEVESIAVSFAFNISLSEVRQKLIGPSHGLTISITMRKSMQTFLLLIEISLLLHPLLMFGVFWTK